MFKLKIRRVGNSAGVTLPKQVLAALRVQEGDTLILTESPDGFKVTPHEETFEAGMKAFERTFRKYRNALRELAK
ncbi:MAG: AbrB/MazE/SpoVT family DNA-binding domain-containing protein [Kiloniellales bacterium]